MSSFKIRRSIYRRVVVYSLLLLSIGLTQAAVDMHTLRQVSRSSVALERNWVQGTTLLGNIDFDVEAFRLAEVQRVLAFDAKSRASAEAQANARRVEIAGYARSFAQLLQGGDTQQLADFDRAWTNYQADHDSWVAGDGDAMALPNSTLDADDKATDTAVDALVNAYSAEGAARAAAGVKLAHSTMRFDIAAALLCLALCMLTQFGARIAIISPLHAITAAMTRLAGGDRETPVPGRERTDEIGEMAAACEVFRLNVILLEHAHEAARQAEQQAQLLARHDALTGLPNRRVFSADLEAALARAQKGNCCYALLLIDLDDFKKVNDIQGHQAGDVVLCEVAHRLEQAVRKNDTLARLGGDEFAIITQGGPDLHEHLEQTKRLDRKSVV